ncbi:TatD family hydrolase [Haliea sp. AH-315-K21]|uniref:Hydrolase TatD n=1 Tax=SAR86 cluster bacterium TaxID=2030880 RepID=A0A2A5CFH5_9GAMM|nr:TatD family hydrolase [Haliea sp. AH-315-K21]MBN4075170.1 TatD family hydrolase [Gammaproteobacteria bacterium AH-315-E17]PCJ42251.1 MAG: hydrolase TatD [SAR86 cluster bacterium]
MIDIGANLSHESFRDDFDEVIKRAKQARIEKLILTGTDVVSNQRAIALCQRYPDYLFSTVGLHPHEASSYTNELNSVLREQAMHSCVKALGETGLDFNRNYSTPKEQEVAFIEQLGLAVELKMPLFLHQRDAHERFLPILKDFRDQLSKIVVHCFTGTKEELFDYLDMDLHIGITGWVCDERRGYSLHPLLKEIPNNRLMLETDAPYLMPRNIEPKPDTRRNEPANLSYVLEKTSECLGKSPESVAKQTSSNARDFFAL